MNILWLIPIFALVCAVNRVDRFIHASPTHPAKYLWLAKAIVDLYFVAIYSWVALTPNAISIARAGAVRTGVLVLFTTNVVAIMIERDILYHLVQKMKLYFQRLKSYLLLRGYL